MAMVTVIGRDFGESGAVFRSIAAELTAAEVTVAPEAEWVQSGIALHAPITTTDIAKASSIVKTGVAAAKVDGAVRPLVTADIKLAVFDMDSTLIQMETIDELARFAKAYDKVSLITERAMKGEIDFKTALAERVALLKGVDATEAYAKVAQTAVERVTKGARLLVTTLIKKHHAKIVIVSGGFAPVCRAVAQVLGVDTFYANDLEVKEGRFTGRLLHGVPIVDAAFKEMILRRYAAELNLRPQNVLAVGDGANDIPMMKAAGTGVAFCAKPLVQKQATYSLNTPDLALVLHYLGARNCDSAGVEALNGLDPKCKL